MPDAGEPLQTDEVVEALTGRKACALIHLDDDGNDMVYEVYVSYDSENGRGPWGIAYAQEGLPGPAVIEGALALGFLLEADPAGRGAYVLSRRCAGVRAAAVKALRFARLLPGVAVDGWLWVANAEYGERGPTPAQPSPWPPKGI